MKHVMEGAVTAWLAVIVGALCAKTGLYYWIGPAGCYAVIPLFVFCPILAFLREFTDG